MLYLILHKVRGEPAYDIAQKLDLEISGQSVWIIPTSGHRAYPYMKWPLEDLIDGSDVNASGFFDLPWTFDHHLPENWPDHYTQAETMRHPKVSTVTLEDLLK